MQKSYSVLFFTERRKRPLFRGGLSEDKFFLFLTWDRTTVPFVCLSGLTEYVGCFGRFLSICLEQYGGCIRGSVL